jgi:hypothetical protein
LTQTHFITELKTKQTPAAAAQAGLEKAEAKNKKPLLPKIWPVNIVH